MILTSDASVDWAQAISNIRIPTKADERLRDLLERNSNNLLRGSEREELDLLIELSEEFSMVRAEALSIIERQPF